MGTKRVLLVEDEKAIRETVKNILESEGYSVVEACNGKEALAILQNETPSVILLDMIMPIMSGWDLLDFLKCDSEKSKIPVVIISAYGEIAKSVNPKWHIPKPVQLHSLLKALQESAA